MTPRHRRIQPRIKGGRDPLFSAVFPETRDKLIAIAKDAGVSPSWVIATVLADFCGTHKRQARYDDQTR